MPSRRCNKIVGLVLGLIAYLPSVAWAAAYDNSAKGSSAVAATTQATGSFAVAGNYLLACVGSGASTPVDPSAVKWGGSGGTSMTQKGTTLNLGSFVKWSLWELKSPTAQTSTVHVTWPSSQDEKWVLAISFAGIDQTTPTRTVATATGSGGLPTFTITVDATSQSGDLVVDCASFISSSADNATMAVNGSQTSRQEVEGTDLAYEGGGTSTLTASGASTTMAWTVSGLSATGNSWGTYAMALIDAASATCGYLVTNIATDQLVTEIGDAFTNEIGACDDFPLPFRGGRGRMRGR